MAEKQDSKIEWYFNNNFGPHVNKQALEFINIFEQLLFAMSGARWLEQPGDKPALDMFHGGAVQQAIWACMLNGAFAEVDESSLCIVYENITGCDWSEFVEANRQNMIAS